MTGDLEGRIHHHNHGFDLKAYTYRRRPLKLVYHTYFHDVNFAIAFEKKIKKWSQAKKIALIEGRFEDLPGLSMNKSQRKLKEYQDWINETFLNSEEFED